MSNATRYTQEQLDIALIKNNNEVIPGALKRLEQRIERHFRWTLGLLFGLYAISLTELLSALGRAYGWF